MTTNPTKMTKLFVYGTLRKGFSNYQRVMQDCVHHYLGIARTLEPIRLFCDSYYIPYAVCGKGGVPIVGELFSVDEELLEKLDELEGVASGRYSRVQVRVVASDGSGEHEVGMYCITSEVPRLETRAMIEEYTAELNSHWVPRDQRDPTIQQQPWGGYD
mmetsp:Transcript_31354/g.47401  ORF Transcript_31354/g.47401 Transcript_31354/m.47401 type:complete len:159 (-) Transcript_31354:800-1276(-)